MKSEKKIIDMVENRITEHQLSKLKQFDQLLTEGRNIIGDMTIRFEFEKSQVLSKISEINKDLSAFKNDLKEQYGEIDIDLSSGVYTKKEE